MAWTNPALHIFTTGEVVTASTMNTYIEANLAFLGGTLGSAVLTAETTSSTTYTDLTTVGPSVTVTTQTTAVVVVAAAHTATSVAFVGTMSYAVSGSSSIAASDATALFIAPPTSSLPTAASMVSFISGLTPGSNIFTAKYRTNGTSTFQDRSIIVIVQPT